MSFDEWFFSMFVSYFIFEILGDTGKVQPCFLFFLNLVSTFYFECISTLYHIIKFDLLLLNGLKAVMQRNALPKQLKIKIKIKIRASGNHHGCCMIVRLLLS